MSTMSPPLSPNILNHQRSADKSLEERKKNESGRRSRSEFSGEFERLSFPASDRTDDKNMRTSDAQLLNRSIASTAPIRVPNANTRRRTSEEAMRLRPHERERDSSHKLNIRFRLHSTTP